ncbi:MAG: hypothetical protein WCA49_03010 [Candidatus Sulfotelmatobacter sp.]
MTGMGWRLLAAFSLIFVAALLRGQDVAYDRSSGLTPTLAPSRYSPITEPVPPPEPVDVPLRYPVAPGSIALPQMVFPQIVFRQIVRSAGIIFAGRVISVGRDAGRVERTAATPFGQGAASTAVTFRVEHAIRGSSAGHNLTIHEWSGLWTSDERYRVGERVLLFLYSPSRLGLTSPVAGLMGRFAINPQGQIVMNAQNAASLAADPWLSGKMLSGKVLSGKTIVPYADFLEAVRRAGGEE